MPQASPLDLSALISPEEIQAMIQTSYKSQLESSVHEATAELAKTLVHAEVHKHLAPTARGLIDAQQYDAYLAKAEEDSKQAGKLEQRMNPQDPKGLLYDPFTALDQMGFRERPTAITYKTLAEMARRIPPYTAILQTRINQIAAFSEPQPDEHSIGYKIKLRDRRQDMTPALERRADELARWVERCGNPNVTKKRDGFEHFLRKTTWDALAYDQWNAEVIPDQLGRPSYWRILDAATIRISDDLDESDDTDETIQYVQVYDDTIIAEFKEKELIFGVRNPRSDIRYAGYGTSELEMLVVIVTAILWGIDYNAKFFKQGTVAKGLLNFKGAIPDRELVAFRRHWNMMLTGVQGAWRTPIVNSDEVQWINMQQSNRDMEFAGWLDWLLKVTCAVMQIAPEEIGFQFGNGGQSSSMGEGSQEHKLKFSKDKGLVPLAKFIAAEFNKKVLWKLDDRFSLEFAGINARSAEELIDLQEKEGKTLKTVDELRKERGMEALPNGLGQMINSPTWVQWASAQGGGTGGGDGDGLDRGGLEAEDDDGDDDDDDEMDDGNKYGHAADVDNEDDGDEQGKVREFDKSLGAAGGRPIGVGIRRILNLEIDV
jgi:hypothetical protein